PLPEMVAQRIHRIAMRHWIGPQDALAIVVPRAVDRDVRRALGEAPPAAAVRSARDVIAANVLGKGNVSPRVRSHPFNAKFQSPDLGRAEMFDDLRTGSARAAAIENAPRGQAANVILVAGPPLGPFAAGLVELEHAVRLRPAEVERYPPARDD